MSKKFLALFGLVLCAVVAVGCTNEPPSIAVVLPLTGDDAALGEAAKHGLEVALADLEAKGGVTFTLHYADSQSDPAMAAQQLDQLFQDTRAVTAIGGLTPGESRALAEVAHREEKVLLMPSASEQHLRVGSKWVYQLAPSNGAAGSTFAAFANRHFAAATATLIAQDQSYADDMREGFDKTFTSLGGEVGGVILAESGQEVSLAAPALNESKPDLIVLSGDARWQIEAIEELKVSAYDGEIFAPRTFAHPVIQQELGQKASGVLFAYSDFSLDDTRPHVREFIEQYEARFGEAPELMAAESWDALHIAALAYADRAALASEIRRGLRDQVKNYNGASGTLQFDEHGGVSIFPRVFSLTADLEMRDHGVYLNEQKAILEAKAREIAKKRKALLEQLNNVGNG